MTKGSISQQAGTLEVRTFDDRVSLTLRGVIDSRLRPDAGQAFGTIMLARLPLTIIARQATFADAPSWIFLVQLVKECIAVGIPVTIDVRDEHVRKVLTDLGLVSVA